MGCCESDPVKPPPPPKPPQQAPAAERYAAEKPPTAVKKEEPKPKTVTPPPPAAPPPPPEPLSCSNYFPGTAGEFFCDGGAGCPQRQGTVWGGGEIMSLCPEEQQKKTDEAAESFRQFFKGPTGGKAKIYAAASSICRCAIHAGVLRDDVEGENNSKFRVVLFERKRSEEQQRHAPSSMGGAILIADAQPVPPSSSINGSVSNGVESVDVAWTVSRWIAILPCL